MTLQTFTSFEDALVLAPEWDALITQLQGSLYMTFGWCQVWWRHYGDGRQLRLMVVRADDDLAGVLPFLIDEFRSPLGRTRVAKLVGCDSTPAVVEPVIAESVAATAFALAMKQLFVDDRADVVHVGPCSAADAQLDALRGSVGELGVAARIVRDRESSAQTVFEMPDGFDAYMQTLSKNQRSNYRRNLNKLKSSFEFQVDVVCRSPLLDTEFEAFVDMHQAQWQAVNKLGHFGDWPGSREFSRDLVRTLAGMDRVRLIRLLTDGKVVAYYWCFAMNGTYYWRLPARLTGAEWDPYALGRVGLMKMMEVAAANGATAIEAGMGRYEYKERLNARILPLRSLTLCRGGQIPRMRAWLTLAYGSLLDLTFYRLWYLRAAPRLGILRRPLRRSWIRRRF